jgi:hypothetical protein
MADADSKRERGGNEKRVRQPVATWRKVLAVVFAALVVGPLLYAMFASYFTGTPFGLVFQEVGFYWPYLGLFIPIAIVIGLYDFWRRHGD